MNFRAEGKKKKNRQGDLILRDERRKERNRGEMDAPPARNICLLCVFERWFSGASAKRKCISPPKQAHHLFLISLSDTKLRIFIHFGSYSVLSYKWEPSCSIF